jgi:hypothetical protein
MTMKTWFREHRDYLFLFIVAVTLFACRVVI